MLGTNRDSFTRGRSSAAIRWAADAMTNLPEFSRAKRLIWSCRLVVVVWFFAAAMGLFVVGLAIGIPVPRRLLVGTWWAFVVWGFLMIALESTFRCDHCRRRFMIEGFGAKHAAARRRGRMNYWASAIADVMWDRVFTCMYCGHQFRVST